MEKILMKDYLFATACEEISDSTDMVAIWRKKCAKKALDKKSLTNEELMLLICGYLDTIGVSEDIKANIVELA